MPVGMSMAKLYTSEDAREEARQYRGLVLQLGDRMWELGV